MCHFHPTIGLRAPCGIGRGLSFSLAGRSLHCGRLACLACFSALAGCVRGSAGRTKPKLQEPRSAVPALAVQGTGTWVAGSVWSVTVADGFVRLLADVNGQADPGSSLESENWSVPPSPSISSGLDYG